MMVRTFRILALEEIKWPDGRIHISPGAFGKALSRFGGRNPGYVIEWETGDITGVYADRLGKGWIVAGKTAPAS